MTCAESQTTVAGLELRRKPGSGECCFHSENLLLPTEFLTRTLILQMLSAKR